MAEHKNHRCRPGRHGGFAPWPSPPRFGATAMYIWLIVPAVVGRDQGIITLGQVGPSCNRLVGPLY